MGTEGAAGPGAGIRCGLALLLAAGLCTGCGPAGTGAPGEDTSATPSASATSPEDLCTRVVSHWSRKVLDSDTYGDYQTMGLSNGQYDILRDVVDAARATKKRQGAAAADAVIVRRARAGCRSWYRSGGPSNGPWQ